jgi:hypothetical protein
MIDKQEYIQRVKARNKELTGSDISDTEALDIFENLITLTSAIYKSIPKQHER